MGGVTVNFRRFLIMFFFSIGSVFFLIGNSFGATLEAGYNNVNGDDSGYLDYIVSKNGYRLGAGGMLKDGLLSSYIKGSYKEAINTSYDVLASIEINNNPRLDMLTVSTKIGLDYLLIMDDFTFLTAGYGLDALGIRNKPTLFNVYYDFGLHVDFKSFTLDLQTFGNSKLKQHSAEANYKFKQIKETSAGLKYTLTDYDGNSDYMLTSFIKTEF